jgi:hypothetical protein
VALELPPTSERNTRSILVVPSEGRVQEATQQQLQPQQPLPQQPILAEIQPMPEKMMRFNASSGVDGKALLHDLD